MEECQEIDLEYEADDLIDNNQFLAMSAEKEVNASLGIDTNDQLPELHESIEPAGNQRKGRYNLRKSLAWDSAFFTSAGVLDLEELSSMITGAEKSDKPSLPGIQEAVAEKSGKPLLPGIQEEITGSTESLSTLGSDNLTHESFEDDLFGDIRASIQRSRKKAFNLTNSNCKTAAMEVDGTAISSVEKEEFVSQKKNPKPVLKKSSGLQTVRMSKCQPKQTGKLASGKSIKQLQDSVHPQVASIAKVRGTNSTFPKPPKTGGFSVPSSTTTAKRESVGTDRVKPECGSSKLGSVSSKSAQPPRIPTLSGSRKVLPKAAVSSKCSSTTSSAQSTRSSTSSDSSISTSSGIPAKSSLMIAKRNPCKNVNIGTGSSGSNPKTPSRAAPKNKLPASTLSSYLMSSKISSNVSPASSISEWSSASSTSSMINQRSNNSRTSFDTSSHRSMDSDDILQGPRDHSTDQTAEGHENRGVTLTGNTFKESSTQAGTLHAPAKPSGLRMPSPKIGFFDGMKSSARTPNGHQQSQSGLHTVFPKNRAATPTPIRSSNGKLKSAKVPTARTLSSLAATKPSSPMAASPASFREESHASRDDSTVATDIKDSSSLSFGVEGSATGETCQEAEEVQVEDGTKEVLDTGIDAIDKENLGDLNMYKNMGSGNTKTACAEGRNTSEPEYIDQTGDSAIGETRQKAELMQAGDGVKQVVDTGVGAIAKENLGVLSTYKSKSFVNVKSGSGERRYTSESEYIDQIGDSATGEDRQKAEGIWAEDGLKQVVDVGVGAIGIENLDELSVHKNTGSGEVKTASGEEHSISGQYIDQTGDSAAGENHQKAEAIWAEDGVELVVDAGVVAINKDNLGDLSMYKNTSYGNVMTASGKEGNISGPEYIDQIGDSAYGENNQKAEGIRAEDGVKQVVDADVGAIDQEKLDDLSVYKSTGCGDVKTGSDEVGNNSGPEHVDQICDNVLISHEHLKKDSHPIYEAPDKKNGHAKRQEEGLTGEKRGIVHKNINVLTCEFQSDNTSECAVSSPACASDSAACRAPLAVKNSSCSNECVDLPKELVIDKTGLVLPSYEQKENS